MPPPEVQSAFWIWIAIAVLVGGAVVGLIRAAWRLLEWFKTQIKEVGTAIVTGAMTAHEERERADLANLQRNLLSSVARIMAGEVEGLHRRLDTLELRVDAMLRPVGRSTGADAPPDLPDRLKGLEDRIAATLERLATEQHRQDPPSG